MAAQKLRFVNLLPRTEFEASFWGKILKWSLSTGRYMIILTEMVVIVAFMSRFVLDKDLSDVADSISGKKAYLDANAAYEQEFRLVQARLLTANQLLGTQMQAGTILDRVTSRVPEGLKITTLLIDKGEITINGQGSQPSFEAFISRISAEKSFRNLNLATISYDTEAGVKFSLKANY